MRLRATRLLSPLFVGEPRSTLPFGEGECESRRAGVHVYNRSFVSRCFLWSSTVLQRIARALSHRFTGARASQELALRCPPVTRRHRAKHTQAHPHGGHCIPRQAHPRSALTSMSCDHAVSSNGLMGSSNSHGLWNHTARLEQLLQCKPIVYLQSAHASCQES